MRLANRTGDNFRIQEKKMNGCIQYRIVACLLVLAGSAAWAGQPDERAELKLFEGSWTVVKLIEDGKVIPAERIPDVLASGGRLEIVDNSLLSVDSHSGKRHAQSRSTQLATRAPSILSRPMPRTLVAGFIDLTVANSSCASVTP